MHKSANGGFTLIEVIVVIAVLALLAGLALPMIGSTTNDARVTKMLTGVDQYRKACQRYKNDTRTYPIETANRQGARFHQLSMKQDNVVGWKGPYIDHVMATADNPFDADVVIMNDLNAVGRFDLDGDGKSDAHGEGACVVYSNIDEVSAQQIDEALDKGISGDWKNTGRVKWNGSKRLSILLHFE